MLRRFDAFQRRHRWVGTPLAVLYKFVDDQGTYQAALLAYYGFVSLFPLLLLAVTTLGFVLAGDPAAQEAVLGSALRNFPVIGDQLGDNVASLQGSVTAVVVGIVVSLYGGLGVTQAALSAMHQMWAVPVAERPGIAAAYGRGALVLVAVGGGVLTTAVLTTVIAAVDGLLPIGFGAVGPVLAFVAGAVLNTGLFLLGYRLLTVRDVALRRLLPGAVIAAVVWQLLLVVGSYFVENVLQGSSASYGVFGIVLGLLAWIYLGALVLLFCAEINVVRELELRPRSLFAPVLPDDPDLTAGDERAYTAYAGTQRHKSFERVEVTFDTDPDRPS